MTALILKDIATLKKTLLLTITICIALAVYGIYENVIFITIFIIKVLTKFYDEKIFSVSCSYL